MLNNHDYAMSERSDSLSKLASTSPKPQTKEVKKGDMVTRFKVGTRTSRVERIMGSLVKEKNNNEPFIYRLANHRGFKVFMNTVIILSCIEIGIGVDAPTHDYCVDGAGSVAIQTLILFFFIAEYIILTIAFGKKYVFSEWGAIDFVLTMSGIFSTLIFGMIELGDYVGDACEGDIGHAGMAKSIGHAFTSLRVIRVLQLARLVRLVASFQLLWSMVRGMENAVKALGWTFLLMLMWFYFFAIIGVQLIGKNSWLQKEETPKIKLLTEEKYGTVLSAMLTSLQIATLDSWNSQIAGKILHETSLEPGSGQYLCFFTSLYFLMVVGIGALMIMNLVTAIIVEQSIAGAKQDKEAQIEWETERIKQVTKDLYEAFKQADTDGDGMLNWDELEDAFKDNKSKIALNLRQIGDLDTIKEMFQLMDTDVSGYLDAFEFTDGVQRFQTDFTKFMLIQIQRSQSTILGRLQELEQRFPPKPPSPIITPRGTVKYPDSGTPRTPRTLKRGLSRASERNRNSPSDHIFDNEDCPDIIQL